MFLPVEHGQDDEWGHDKHLHVGPQVPSLTQATPFLGQVGYVEDDVPPLFGTAKPNPLVVRSVPSLCGYVLRDGDVETDDEGQGYCQSATNGITCIL